MAADAAIKRTLARAGPTQGVHAKLKVKPSRKAVTGDMAAVPTENGSRCSLERSLDGDRLKERLKSIQNKPEEEPKKRILWKGRSKSEK